MQHARRGRQQKQFRVHVESVISAVFRRLRYVLLMLIVLAVNPAFGADVLLVDDDDNAPDVRSLYTMVLDALGVIYDVRETNNTDNEPDEGRLSQYHTVIWVTGDSGNSVAGQGPMGEPALASYRDISGCLFISSEDYCWSRGLTGFMSGYPGVASVTDDVAQTMIQDHGTGFFDGLGPCTLSCPVVNWSDTLTPDGTATLALTGNNGDAAVYKIAGSGKYRPTFCGYPLEDIPSSLDLPRVGDRWTVLYGVNDKGQT